MTIKGSDIWDAFEFSFRRYSPNIGYGEFLQVSGMYYLNEHDPTISYIIYIVVNIVFYCNNVHE